MKQLLACIVLSMLIFSCKKNSVSNNNNAANTYYLSSVKSISPQNEIVDSVVYDTSHAVVKFLQYYYNTPGGSATDSIVTNFLFQPNATLPGSYTLYTDGNTETHYLSYDNQNRITKDTCHSSGFVSYYTYPGNNIATTVLFEGDYSDNQVDTIFVNNKNISSLKVYYPNDEGSADSLSGTANYAYSSYVNPAYSAGISNTVGPLLFILTYDGYGTPVDFISNNLPSSLTGTGDGIPAGTTITFNYTKDGDGRIVKAVPSYYGIPATAYSTNYTYY